MENRAPAIELIDADIRRTALTESGSLAALQHVRWRVDQGDFWAVGAAPGAGKTDLLSTAAALQRPIKGAHLLFGKDTREMDEHELVESHRKVAIVFDSGRLFPQLTIAENLQLPLAYHTGAARGELAARVEAVLAATGLQKMRDKLPSQVTRNLHQRAGLARALTLRPEVLLIDSPLMGIDARQSRWWLEFLRELHRGHEVLDRRSITIAVATTDFRPWSDVATRFAFIRDRQLRIAGGSAEVCATEDTVVQELFSSPFDEE